MNHHHHGPYVTGAISPWAPYGGAGFGGGCFYNGFTGVCGPGGGFGYMGPCPRYGYRPCGPWGPGWGWGGAGLAWGWGGYPGYGYTGDLGYDQMESAPPAEDSYPGGEGMDVIGGYYGDTPPSDQSEAEPAAGVAAAPNAAPAQLIFKNGSAYAVKSYWLEGSELYYQPVYGGRNHVALEQLDLSATVEANSRAGVPFTLTTQPPQN
ncbi:MAG TPA: hypothetical protein VL099_01035 [Candidatus Binatia bacterium]|nr:hypothetical protein [Candidatus Binatia bacterium]